MQKIGSSGCVTNNACTVYITVGYNICGGQKYFGFTPINPIRYNDKVRYNNNNTHNNKHNFAPPDENYGTLLDVIYLAV